MADKDIFGDTPAHVAAAFGQVEALRVLKDLGCPMAEKTSEGYTAAHVAAKKGHAEALQALRELGCPMAEKDNAGFTAMRYMVRAGHGEALRQLRDSGCPKAVRPNDNGARTHEEHGEEKKEKENEEESGSCTICLERDAWWVLELCGHKCVCKACMRNQKQTAAGATVKKARKKGSPAVVCPLCRAETRAVPASDYGGRIFENL